jgi:hypothetical protein
MYECENEKKVARMPFLDQQDSNVMFYNLL